MAPMWKVPANRLFPHSHEATANEMSATASRVGCPGSNAVVSVGNPRRITVNAAHALRAGGADGASRITQTASTNSANAMMLTCSKLRMTLPVAAYATAAASGNAGVSLLIAEALRRSWLVTIAA